MSKKGMDRYRQYKFEGDNDRFPWWFSLVAGTVIGTIVSLIAGLDFNTGALIACLFILILFVIR